VINNKNAPTYKIARKLNNILKQQLQMENQYSTQNSEKRPKLEDTTNPTTHGDWRLYVQN
jgi:hypothetical protein